jgi:hypothetical protein
MESHDHESQPLGFNMLVCGGMGKGSYLQFAFVDGDRYDHLLAIAIALTVSIFG